MTDILEDAIAFIEGLTANPLLTSDDVEMSLEDVQAHARIEATALRKRAHASHEHAPAGMEADAARYRWLREQRWYEDTVAVVISPKTAVKLGQDCPFDERLDEIIDAAIGARLRAEKAAAGGQP